MLLGDYLDCESVSHWLKDKARILENKRLLKEYELGNRELDYLAQFCPKITYIEGNHENWVEQYIDHNPSTEGLLEVKKCLNLEARGIKYVKLNHLYKIGKLYFTHGIFATKYHASKHLAAYGASIMYGHTHNAQTAQMSMQMIKPVMAYGLGCLCSHSPYYLHNRPCNWIDQFAVVEFDEKGNFNVTPINITNHQFIYAGKVYK